MSSKRHKRPTSPPTPVFHPYPVQPILQPIAQTPLDSSFPFHQKNAEYDREAFVRPFARRDLPPLVERT